eukprot:1565176-Amphidinium_carterae.1
MCVLSDLEFSKVMGKSAASTPNTAVKKIAPLDSININHVSRTSVVCGGSRAVLAAAVVVAGQG